MNNSRFRQRARRATLAATAGALLVLSGCVSADFAASEKFTERSAEPSAVPMPKFDSPELPSAVVPTTNKPRDPHDPCATDDTTVAACLPLTTSLVAVGPATAVVATATGDLFAITPGTAPRLLVNVGAPVRQLLASPTVAEDGQIFVLRADGSIVRVTFFGGAATSTTPPDVQEIDSSPDPLTVAMYFADGKIQTLLSGDPGIVLHEVCAGPDHMPLLATATLDGVPQLVQWANGWIEPLGGVDLANDIGGCTLIGNRVAVALPEAEKVVSVTVVADAENQQWTVSGSPETLVDGEYGRLSYLTTVAGTQGFEIWGATTNTEPGRGGSASASDERVIRLPEGGAAGASSA